ncbi:AAEL006678-PA [Aedes aegypti]|uniref:AAEL006678-PA n=2 Tax=Aedes aegypti TaxID=7159 RepID=A0A1S4FE95_AEDAE|nr:gametocyte-specific factor 1 [Aedes aegypti]EAT41705.1 AAEL006678-PA [Aedes aegypti]
MDDELVTCPYNKEHRIIRYRLPYHIIKCKKQYVGKQLEPCPFNAMHLVDKNEMTAHIKDCPDYLITVENDMIKEYAPSRSGVGSERFSRASSTALQKRSQQM